MVPIRVNGHFSISSCLILLASQMGREDKVSLKSLFSERMCQVASTEVHFTITIGSFCHSVVLDYLQDAFQVASQLRSANGACFSRRREAFSCWCGESFSQFLLFLKTKWQAPMRMENDQPVNFVNRHSK